MPSVPLVTASTVATDTGASHPNYTANVSIPSPGSGPGSDVILVAVRWRVPTIDNLTGAGSVGPPTLLGAGPAGLTELAEVPGFDDLVSGGTSEAWPRAHSTGMTVYIANRSGYTGGTITATRSQDDGDTDPGELWLSATTVVVRDVSSIASPRVDTDTSATVSAGTAAGFDVQVCYGVANSGNLGFFPDTHYTLNSIENTSVGMWSTLDGPAGIGIGVASALDAPSAITWGGTGGYGGVVAVAWTDTAPQRRGGVHLGMRSGA